jgi:hypothetical protein
MRLLGRLLLYLLVALGTFRMVVYLNYASALLRTPLEAHNLEAKMVLLSWRVQQGLSLYPAWRDYPYVTNFFGPLYFVLVGLLGRLLGVDYRGLFLIGRTITFASGLLTSVVLGLWAGRRYGRWAGVAGGVLSLGSGPMYGFTVMARPDAFAELLGVVGFFLSGTRSRPIRLAGVGVLVLAILTKQTAAAFLLAAALAEGLADGWRRALGVLAGGLAALSLVVVAINFCLEPHFARSLVGEAMMPWEFGAWSGLLRTIARSTPDVLIVPMLGLAFWLGRRPREVRPATLTGVMLASSLILSGKVGADMNYYLGLRIAEGLAVGALWQATRSAWPVGRLAPAALVGAVALSAVSLLPCTMTALGQVVHAWRLAIFFEGPLGRTMLLGYRTATARARNPEVRLLTDSGLIDIYQGERAAFGDPWLFRQLVERGLLDPATIRDRIDSQYYDWIITAHNLAASDYAAKDLRLPMVLAERVRARYVLTEIQPGLFFFSRLTASRSAVAGTSGDLAR